MEQPYAAPAESVTPPFEVRPKVRARTMGPRPHATEWVRLSLTRRDCEAAVCEFRSALLCTGTASVTKHESL